MALTERQIIGKIEILEDGVIQLREDTVIERDGIEIQRLYHRRVLEPGQNVAKEDARVKRITTVVWTPAVVTARRVFRENQQNTL